MQRNTQNVVAIAESGIAFDQEVFRIIFERTPIGMLIARTDGSIERVKPAICELLGYSQEELLTPSISITHPDDLNLYESIVTQMQEPSVRFLSAEKRCLRKDGTTIHAL